MSQTKNAVELCALLVDATYGELACRITTILLRRGRLTVPVLARYTDLSLREIRHGLVVLIQQNLVYHYFDHETRLTYYEANHDTAFALARSGKIIELVERRYGMLARDVMQNLLLLGNTKIADLVAAYASNESPRFAKDGNEHPPLNGISESSRYCTTTPAKLDSILIRLLSVGLIETVSEKMFRSPSDTYNQVESEILHSGLGGEPKGTKQKDEVKARIRERLQDIRSDRPNWSTNRYSRSLNGEHVNMVNGSGKRKRCTGANGAINSNRTDTDEDVGLDQDLVVRINYEKCAVCLRNQRIVEFAERRIGRVTSRLYGELLQLLEDGILRCRVDPKIDDIVDIPDGQSVTTVELGARIEESFGLTIGIGKTSYDKISTKTPRKIHDNRRAGENESFIDVDQSDGLAVATNAGNHSRTGHWIPLETQPPEGDVDDSSSDDPATRAPKRSKVTFEDKLSKEHQVMNQQPRLSQVKDHLELLSTDECGFLRHCGSRGLGEWTVDFDGIVQRMKDAEIDVMLLENFGVNGHRLARILKKFGKVDEKQLSNLALIKQKDVRTKMVEMQIAGVVDVQEIPRDSARSTARSVYLWFFDMDRTSKIFLDSAYKNMSKSLQRLAIERRRAKDILELLERSDLRGTPEEEFLTLAQLNELEMFRCKEESLYGHVSRLDDIIGIFRDY